MHCTEDSLIDLEYVAICSYVANYKSTALGLVEIFCFELFNYVFLDNYLCVSVAGFSKASHIYKGWAKSTAELLNGGVSLTRNNGSGSAGGAQSSIPSKRLHVIHL